MTKTIYTWIHLRLSIYTLIPIFYFPKICCIVLNFVIWSLGFACNFGFDIWNFQSTAQAEKVHHFELQGGEFAPDYTPRYAFFTFSFESRFSEDAERVMRPFSIT